MTVTLSHENFAAKKGRDDLINLLGYSRKYDTEDGMERRSRRSNLGTDYWNGPSFRESLGFGWRLQLLSIEQCDQLLAMSQKQRQAMDSVRLYDERFVTSEAGTRTRAKTSTPILEAPTIAGMNYYWGQYDLELIVEPASFVLHGVNRITGEKVYKATFGGREHELVPTSQDI